MKTILNIFKLTTKSTNRLVTILLPFTIFVDVDTDLTFLDGMPLPSEEEKLENDENLSTKPNSKCHYGMTYCETQKTFTPEF